MNIVERKTWEEFRNVKLLWWINRLLHTFGWAIVVQLNEAGEIIEDVYPARVKFRGFDRKSESDGFVGLTEYLATSIDELMEEVDE